MKTVWRLYKRQITWIAAIAAVVGYVFAGWGVWAMSGADEATFTLHMVKNTLLYGTIVSAVLFVLIVGVVIPRSAYYADGRNSHRPGKLVCSGSPALEEMGREQAERWSRIDGYGSTSSPPEF